MSRNCRTSGSLTGTGPPALMRQTSRKQTRKADTMAENTITASVPVADDNTLELALSGDKYGKMDITADIASGKSGYCSMVAEDDRAKVTLYNSISNPAKVSDMINKQIKLLHVYAEIIQVTSEETGELVSVPRVILIDEKGKGYQAVSIGIYNAVKRLIALFGTPDTWQKAHTVEVQNVQLAGGQHTMNLLLID